MTQRGGLGIILTIVVGAGIYLAVWRPFIVNTAPRKLDMPVGDAQDNAFTPPTIDPSELVAGTKMLEFVYVNNSGSPCKVTVVGGYGRTRDSMSAELAVSPARSSTMASGPYTIEAVLVERAGTSRRHEMNVTVPAGERREIRVNPDDGVEVIPATK
jgi:hypothetical protein